MTKQELIEQIAAKTGTSKAEALRHVAAMEEVVREELAKGGEVALANGKFTLKETPERTGRNPKTGESMLIPAKRKVVFKPAKVLKVAVA